MSKVIVAVVSWNTRELLRACLSSLAGSGARVVVVDNGSVDGSPEMVREEFGWVELIEPGANLGFGPAVNLAVERCADAELVVAANADVRFEPGSLEALAEALARDPGAGMAASRLVLPDGSVQHSVHPFPTVGRMIAAAFGLFGERLCLVGRWNPDRARRVDWAHGAVLMIRRDAWDAVDGFDPDVWMYGEDLDLAWRLRRAGFATRYEPRAVVHHAQSAAATQAFGDEKDAREWDAAYSWMVRRRGRAAALGVALVNVLGSLRSQRFRALHLRGLKIALRRGGA